MDENKNNPSQMPQRVTLSPQDGAAVDAALARRAGGPRLADGEPVSESDAKRERCAGAWLDLAGQCPAADAPADLVARTMARVAAARERERLLVGAQAGGGGGGGMRWAEVGTVAAVVLVGLSLLFPVLNHYRANARQIACETNLQLAGGAMGRYAADNNGYLPRRGTWTGATWWNVGKQANANLGDEPLESNSGHLYQLIRGGYAAPSGLACPDNANATARLDRRMNDWPNPQAVSYSYQNQYAPTAPRIERSSSLAVLADKNPLFAPSQRGSGLRFVSSAPATTASAFHGGRGQNILRANGSAGWSHAPVLSNGDNIWLASGVDQYNGTETPASDDDSFLVP